MLGTKKQIKKYLIMSACIFILALIYEYFSHGVYSIFMLGAFLIPLLMGTLGYKLLFREYTSSLYNASILAFTLGSILKGILDIYGTTNSLVNIYFYVGIILLVLSITLSLQDLRK